MPFTRYTDHMEEIPLSKIQVFIHRERDPEIKERLNASIRNHGLFLPITVIRKPDDTFQLVKGQGRTIAHQELGLSTIRAFVFEDGQLTDSQIIQNWLIENEVREKMSTIDKIRLMKIEKELNIPIEETAKKFKVKPSTVKQYIDTMDMASENVIKMVEDEKIPFTPVKEIVAATKKKETQDAIATLAVDDKLTSEEIRTATKAAKSLERIKEPVDVNTLRKSLQGMKKEINNLKPVVAKLQRNFETLKDCVRILLKNKEFLTLIEANGLHIPEYIKSKLGR